MASYNDLGVIYNHPSIVSNITNNDNIFESRSGSRPFFYVIASERGEDNKIKLISNTEEYLFNYGEPNLKNFGQGPHNILNILQNGESVYVLRVMPDNAGYSHAMLNIQTKVSGDKTVKNVNGDKVIMDNVVIRPTVTYSKANNNSASLLDYEILNNNETTVDGYRNNLLFYAIPMGRGAYYDTFGFRIYLNKSYDDTYDFRVYNFEVIEFDQYDNASIIEGPFYVSLDPDALTNSNESMFITDVVNRYSKYLRITYNEKAYDYISALINPDVTPSHLDILTGITRETGGVKETSYNTITQKQEDVHIKLFKFDKNGDVLTDGVDPITNIIDSSDSVEQSVIGIDNSIRNGIYSRELVLLENMKRAISDIYNGLYENSLELVGKLKDGATPAAFDETSKVFINMGKVDTDWTTFKANKTAFDSSQTEKDFSTAFSSSTLLTSNISVVNDNYSYLNGYSKVVINDSATMNVSSILDNIVNILDTKEIVNIKMISYKKLIGDYISEVVKIKTLQSISDETYRIKVILVEINSIIDYYNLILEDPTNPNMVSIIKTYNEIADLLVEIEGEFTPIDMKEIYLTDVYSKLDVLLSTMLKISNVLILKNDEECYEKLLEDTSDSGYVTGLLGTLATIVERSIKKYNDSKDVPDLKADMIMNAKEVTSIQQDKTSTARNRVYTTQLQDFNQPIPFKYGSEGDLGYEDMMIRNKTMNDLLIKGYKGLIDDSITSKKIIPARFVLDANYPNDVKNAIHVLTTEIRDDLFFYCDLGFTATPEEALAKRTTEVNFSSMKIAIYSQDFTVYDEHSGRDIKVTTPYFLASKIPSCSKQYGLHFPIAGNKRGIIDGFKTPSWIPNETYKELLYNKKVNYIESDTTKTKFGCQLTSDTRTTPLSNINNVITVIDIKNDIELMAENYQFEFNNQETIDAFQNELTEYLSKYTSSKAAERIEPSVFASDYDKLQKILRVSIVIKFYDIIERILINLDVVKK